MQSQRKLQMFTSANEVLSLPGCRVVLKLATEADTHRTLEAIDPNASKNLSFFSQPLNVERQLAYLSAMVQSQSDLLFIIERADDGAAIGAIGLHEIDYANRNARIGLMIFNPRDRGRGYSTEALEILECFAFVRFELNKLYIRVLVENDRALHKYERRGYVKEGVLRQEYLLNEIYHDMHCLGLLRGDWLPHSRKK